MPIIECQSSDELIQHLKSSKHYQNFKSILSRKATNEDKAKSILESNSGRIKHEHLKQIFSLVDENYYVHLGYGEGPWFGRLIARNGIKMLDEDENMINQWFNFLTNNKYSVEERINGLIIPTLHIKGANVGLITLMLYLLNKSEYLIWFGALHEGLKIIHPEVDDFIGIGRQYDKFNTIGKNFAKQYEFKHTEIDWVLWKINRYYRIKTG